MLNNFVSQAGTMQLHGIPNDIMQNIDPITIIIFVPICDSFLYPALRKAGIQFKPITRITWGFLIGAVAIGYAALTQKLIYAAPPCFNRPLSCEAAKLPDGRVEHNHVHVALQTPTYFLIALSEIFASITGLEYAYTKAPASMKSFIMSMFLLTSAFGAALGAAISPFAHNPNLIWFYVFLTGISAISGCVFWILFSRYNATEDAMNELAPRGERSMRLDRLPKLPLTTKISSFDLHISVKEQERSSGDGKEEVLVQNKAHQGA